MPKWFFFLILTFVLLIVPVKNTQAQEGKILFECGDEVVEFPAYFYYISPFIREVVEHPVQPYRSVAIRYDADIGYVQVLKELVQLLPKAARDVNAHPVDRTSIDQDTLFVTSLVRKKLLWTLMTQVCALHQERREGIVSSIISKSRAGSNPSPRKEGLHPVFSSPRGQSSFHGTGSTSPRNKEALRKSTSITHGFRLSLSKVNRGNESPRSEGSSSARAGGATSPRGDQTPKSPRSVNAGVSQILGGLYTLSLELDIKPITNLIAETIIMRLKEEEKGDRIPLQGTLKQLGFGSFPDSELSYLKKHLALKELGKSEYTIADYVGLHGQPSLSGLHEINLSNQGLTGLYGVHLLDNPDQVQSILLHHNSLLGMELDPDFPKTPFKRFSNLKYLFLYQNKLTQLPPEFLDGVNLDVLEIQNNYLYEWESLLPKWLSKVTDFQFAPQGALETRTFGFR